MKKILMLILSGVLFVSAAFGIALFADASEEEDFDPDTYDYDALYVDGALLSFDAYDKKAGDAVESVLATSKKNEKVTLSLSPAFDGAIASWVYGNGYLELSTGASMQANNLLAPSSSVGETKSYTVEYIFGTVDQGEPQAGGEYSPIYVADSYPYTKRVASHHVGSTRFDTLYMSDDGYQTLKSQADAYQAAKADESLRPFYAFIPNEEHLGGDTDGDGKLDYTQTTQLISTQSKYYALLNYDFTAIAGSRVAKTVLYTNNKWKADYDWKATSTEIFRMQFGDTRKLSFLLSTTLGEDGKHTEILQGYRDLTSVMSVTQSGYKAESTLVLARDVGMRVYAVRVYERALTEKELLQNHLADIFKFYRVDPSFYLEASETARKLYDTTLRNVKIGAMSREALFALIEQTESSLIETVKNEYTELYVKDGLLLMVNPMTSEKELEEGTLVTNLTDLDGNFYTLGNADSTASKIEGGVNLGLGAGLKLGNVLPSDGNYSVHLLYAHSDAELPDSKWGHTMHLSIGPAAYGVSFVPPTVDNATPGGITWTWLYMIHGDTGERIWRADFDATWDNGIKQPDLLGEPYDKIFELSNSFSTAEGKIKQNILKDGKLINTVSVTYGEKTPTSLTIGPYFNINFYAALVYDRALTEAEIRQNHFAHLMSYYQVAVEGYRQLDDAQVKSALHEALKDFRIGETSRETLQNIVNSYVLTGGQLSAVESSDYLTFEGIQARIEDYASARALFSVKNDMIAMLEQMGYGVEIGALLAPVGDCDSLESLTVYRDEKLGECRANTKNGQAVTFYRRGESLEGFYGFADDEKRYFSAQIPALNPKDGGEALTCDYYMRAYIAIDINGRMLFLYCDAESLLFGDSVSVSEAAHYFIYSGYAESPVFADICGSYAALAAKAVQESYLEAYGYYLFAFEVASLVSSAHEGALLSQKLNQAAASSIEIGMNPDTAMLLAPTAASTKHAALLYANVAIEKYESAKENLDLAYEQIDLLGTVAYEEARQAGADEESAQKIQQDATDKLFLQISSLDNRLKMLKESIAELRKLIDSYSDYAAENQLSKIFKARATVFVNGTSLSRYTIVTDSDGLSAAEILQKSLLKNFALSVGVYNIDNPYIGSYYDYSSDSNIILGLTKNELAAEGDSYALYGDGKNIYLEASEKEGLKAAIAVLLRVHCAGEGRLRVTLDREANATLAASYAPMVSFNAPASYPAFAIDSYDQNGVYSIFMQALAELPDELSVIEKISFDELPYGETDIYYVAKDGNDKNEGRIDSPLASIEAALDKIAYTGGGAVVIRGGLYSLHKTLSLTHAHSGSAYAPTYITAYPGEEVVFSASKPIDTGAFKTVDQAVSDGTISQAVKERLNTFNPDNSDHIYVAYLSPADYSYTSFADVRLFVGGEMAHVARWPNAGAEDPENGITNGRILFTDKGSENDLGQNDIVYIGEVSVAQSNLYEANKNNVGGWKIAFDNCLYKDHLLSYDTSVDLRAYAAVYAEWRRDHFTLKLTVDSQGRHIMESAEASVWGVTESATNNMYFYNAIEDLDSNDEYFFDRNTGLLFLHSDTPLDDKKVLFSSSNTELLDIRSASDLVVNGIRFEKTQGTGAVVASSSQVILQNCIFGDVVGNGVILQDSRNSGLVGCEFYNTTDYAVMVTSPFDVLSPMRTFVQNCHFHSPNEMTQVAVSLGGVGNIISHNLIEDSIVNVKNAFECIVEYNDINRASQITHDSGPIYISGATNLRGNHIRYNFIHDLNYSGYGIYLDDLCSGNYVYGNIIHYANAVGRCVNLHTGNMNVVYHNIGINAHTGIVCDPNYFVKSINGIGTGGGNLAGRWTSSASSFLADKVDRTVYGARYPMWIWFSDQVEAHIADRAQRPGWNPSGNKSIHGDKQEIFLRASVYNVYRDNVMIACTTPYSTYDYLETRIDEGNLSYASVSDVGFADYENGNFALRADSPVFEDNPNFKPLPFERMGRVFTD